jgi:hypothetical protein
MIEIYFGENIHCPVRQLLHTKMHCKTCKINNQSDVEKTICEVLITENNDNDEEVHKESDA